MASSGHIGQPGMARLCTPANQKAHVPGGNALGTGVPAGPRGPAWQPCGSTQRTGEAGIRALGGERGHGRRAQALSWGRKNFLSISGKALSTAFKCFSRKERGLPHQNWMGGTRTVWHLCKALWAWPPRASGLLSGVPVSGGALPTSALGVDTRDSIQPDLPESCWTRSFLNTLKQMSFFRFCFSK